MTHPAQRRLLLTCDVERGALLSSRPERAHIHRAFGSPLVGFSIDSAHAASSAAEMKSSNTGESVPHSAAAPVRRRSLGAGPALPAGDTGTHGALVARCRFTSEQARNMSLVSVNVTQR